MISKPLLTIIVPRGKNLPLHVAQSINLQTVPVRCIVEEGQNPSANRNRAIKKTKTPFVAFVNAHSILPNNWAEKIISFFKKHNQIDIVGGPQLTPQDQNYFGKLCGHALSSVFGAARARNRYASHVQSFDANEELLTSANLACRVEVTKKISFDESIYPGEDPKFIADARRAGFRVAYDPNMTIFHRRRNTLSAFIRQIFSYGVTRPQKEGLHETLSHPTFLIPPLFVIYLLTIGILTWTSTLFVLPLFLYLILSAGFSLREGIKHNDPRLLIFLPFIFFIIHVSYGLGFIYGLVKYRI